MSLPTAPSVTPKSILSHGTAPSLGDTTLSTPAIPQHFTVWHSTTVVYTCYSLPTTAVYIYILYTCRTFTLLTVLGVRNGLDKICGLHFLNGEGRRKTTKNFLPFDTLLYATYVTKYQMITLRRGSQKRARHTCHNTECAISINMSNPPPPRPAYFTTA